MALDIASVDAAVIAVVGEDLTYTPSGGSATPITGLFQDPDVTPETGDLNFITSGPIAFVLKTDVPTPTNLDTLVRDATSQNYRVKDFETDEGGLVVLELEETP